MKEVDLGEPTSCLDHVYLGCTQGECQTKATILWTMRENMFESRNSAGAAEKLPETKATEKLDTETIYPWSYDMEGHAKKCAERFCELANKTTQQFFKVATPCIDDHQLKEEEIGSVGQLVVHSLLTHCYENVYISLVSVVLDILWSVNKLARAVTKWTKSM